MFGASGASESVLPTHEPQSPDAIPVSDGMTRTLRTSPLSFSYAVDHTVKIPSDGTAHTVTVATIELEADISRVCVPRVQAAVYLQCKVFNKSDYRLLAGDVNVFLNDAYVSQSSIKVSSTYHFHLFLSEVHPKTLSGRYATREFQLRAGY